MRRVDITGQTFGEWKVVKYLEKRKYLCKCSCGKKSEVLNYHLLSGASTKCRECSGLLQVNLQVGDEIGYYKVVDTFLENGNSYCKCICKCGHEHKIRATVLRNGFTTGCKKCTAFKGHGEVPKGYFSQIKRRAIDCKFEFDIDIEYVWQLFLQQNKKCPFLNIELVFASSKDKCRQQTASLDRIDSTKGYIKGNVQWVHKIVNSMKNSLTTPQFIKICNMISENHTSNEDLNLPNSIFMK